jgi:hypothetical protein
VSETGTTSGDTAVPRAPPGRDGVPGAVRAARWGPLPRYLVYTVLLLVGVRLLVRSVASGQVGAFKEGGPVENLQVALLGTAALALFLGAWRDPVRRALFLVMGAGVCLAVVRELDSVFKLVFPVLEWKPPFFLVAVPTAIYAWVRRRSLWAQVQAFTGRASFGVLWAGFVVVAVFAQSVGHRGLLEPVLGDAYDRGVKRVVEEGLEALGYLLVLVGSLEAVLVRPARAPRAPPPGPGDPVPCSD